jgi:hypothetical protein
MHCYALGWMQKAVEDFAGVSVASACRIIKKVSYTIASLRPRYIKMYQNNQEMAQAAEEFYRTASFSRVIGAIDCMLIKINSPGGDDADIFRTRKQFFGVNVQTVSDKIVILKLLILWHNVQTQLTIKPFSIVV